MQITGEGRSLGGDFRFHFHLVSLLVEWTWGMMGLIAFLFFSKIQHSAPLMFGNRVLEVLFGVFIIFFSCIFSYYLRDICPIGFDSYFMQIYLVT